MTAWHSSTRRNRLPPNWPTIRHHVLQRDHYRCQWIRQDTQQLCNQPANQVDHIQHGDNHSLENLQALCEYHHNRKSANEGNQARNHKPSTQPTHPGINL